MRRLRCNTTSPTFKYHSCHAAKKMHTKSEPILNHATRALVASASIASLFEAPWMLWRTCNMQVACADIGRS